jgi:hypothetical protein
MLKMFFCKVMRKKVNLERDGTGLYAIKDKIQIHSKR